MSTRDFSWGKAASAKGWRSTTLVVPNVKKIWGLNLPGTPWATLACCGRPLPFSWLCYWHCWTIGFCPRKLLRFSVIWHSFSLRKISNSSFVASAWSLIHYFLLYWKSSKHQWRSLFINELLSGQQSSVYNRRTVVSGVELTTGWCGTYTTRRDF